MERAQFGTGQNWVMSDFLISAYTVQLSSLEQQGNLVLQDLVAKIKILKTSVIAARIILRTLDDHLTKTYPEKNIQDRVGTALLRENGFSSHLKTMTQEEEESGDFWFKNHNDLVKRLCKFAQMMDNSDGICVFPREWGYYSKELEISRKKHDLESPFYVPPHPETFHYPVQSIMNDIQASVSSVVQEVYNLVSPEIDFFTWKIGLFCNLVGWFDRKRLRKNTKSGSPTIICRLLKSWKILCCTWKKPTESGETLWGSIGMHTKACKRWSSK